MTTPDAVKAIRAVLKESQLKFAKRLGVSVTAVARYEIGQRQPDARALMALRQAARDAKLIELDDVFSGKLAEQLGVSRLRVDKDLVDEQISTLLNQTKALIPNTDREGLVRAAMIFSLELNQLLSQVHTGVIDACTLLYKLQEVAADKQKSSAQVHEILTLMIQAAEKTNECMAHSRPEKVLELIGINERNNNKKTKKKR